MTENSNEKLDEMASSYDSRATEDAIYKLWEDSGFFNPDNLTGEPFSMMLPPPNVTGTLHIGHAYEETLQDIVIRFQRMQGKKVLWLPGTDHAPIATESKVVKLLEKEGKRKTDFTREDFLARVNKFAQESHDTIVNQVKKLGASLDWSREAYTFDEKRNFAVRTAFKTMYDLGLIYRGDRVINWDPKGQTTISDDEIVHEERKAKMYTFKYSADFPISISSTRPETKVGDVAVAVHPADDRYKQFVGKEYDAIFCEVPIHIKIIADESVEKDFGTGALGVTPAHSMIDYEIAQRHNLPLKTVINEFAKMTVEGLLKDKKTTDAREIVVEWLRSQNLLEKEEEVVQNVSTSERTGAVIEPLPKLQWFIDVNKDFAFPHSELAGIKQGDAISLKKLMRQVVESGAIKFSQENYQKVYFNWINNLRDWCISRQIWFGHRIPVWYKDSEIYCGIEAPTGEGWTQDSDTLDTWYSSGLWTTSTLGWPEQTKDFKTYHPTSLVMPGYEILFPWVARMILMTTSLTGQIPFKEVLLHGIVRDNKGRKFSKSLGNGVDPLEIIEQYGADALRIALIFSTAPGNDVIFDEQKVKGMKHFANKIWNIARFVLANTDTALMNTTSSRKPEGLTEADKEVLAKLDEVVIATTAHIEASRFHEAAQALYQFAWYEFADKYIEASKEQLLDANQKENTQKILLYNLDVTLRLLHPFMPFVTEELWKNLKKEKLLLISEWPK
ncbi:MAG: valS [Candidatus Doudnabacteria bacterium]|nr:valS [Candidatus Doudnabacteria bacterium]